jgi:hypothetical protein
MKAEFPDPGSRSRHGDTPGAVGAPDAPVAVRPTPGISGRIRSVATALWSLGFGAFCGLSFLLSFLVVGWAQRAARREVLKTWWRCRRGPLAGETFAEFAEADGGTAELARWPGWLLAQRRVGWRGGSFRSIAAGLLGSLGENARLGVQAAFNTAVFVLPGTLLWAVGWYAGWLNSFNKGYENYYVGMSLFGVGTMLFVAAMFYVPMALARQASTGDWRSFYQFGLVRRLIRRRWLANFSLAVLALGLSVPLLILKTMPGFWPQLNEALLNLSAGEQLRRLERYYFLVSLYGVSAFLIFRLAAARLYARAMLQGVQAGTVTPEELADGEWQALHRLGLLAPRPEPARHWAWRLLRWLGTRAGRITAGMATLLVWLAFVLNVMTHEFFNYHAAGRGWWNQPLIQLPWFDYTPQHLREAAKAERGAATRP